MEQMKRKNTFLVACVSCIVLLMAFCYFGINNSFKITYSATTKTCPSGTYPYAIKDNSGNTLLDVCLHDEEVLNGKITYDLSGNSYICQAAVDPTNILSSPTYFESKGFVCNKDKTLCDYMVSSNQFDSNSCWVKPVEEETDSGVQTEDKYTVMFNKNYSGTCMNSFPNDISGSGLPIDLPSASACDKKFLGWDIVSYRTDDMYYVGDQLTNNNIEWTKLGSDYNVLLFAIWGDESTEVENKYTVTFNKNYNGNCITSFPTDAEVNSVASKLHLTLSKTPVACDKTFVEWNTKADGKGASYKVGDVITGTDSNWISLSNNEYGIVFYAIWSNNEVAKKELTVTLNEQTLTYSGKAVNITMPTVKTSDGNTVNVNGTMKYYTNSTCSTQTTAATGATAAGGAPIDAGTYYMKYTVAETTEYKTATSGCTKLTVKPKDISVKWGSTTQFTYNGNKQGPSASVDTGITGEKMSVTASGATNVGSHTSTATCSSVTGGRTKCSNYQLTSTTKSFTIVAAQEPEQPDEPVNPEQTFVATFDAGNGTLKGSKTLQCKTTGTSCKIEKDIPTATRDGYTFNGWGTSSTCTSGEKTSVTLTKNTTYYACYTKNQVTPPADDNKPEDKPGNVTENPKTGDIAIAVTWFIGLMIIGYSFYYFKSIKEN